uniref:Magnesium transporter n=1 Tax=Haptolina ericina TaxID=156174 RepID=A0A7S3B2B9_9EUKA
MPFAYPVILGILETLVQMCMKGGSSMLLLTLEGQSQLCHAALYIVGIVWILLSVLVIQWLRKGLLVLEASRLLPVEYGTVTSTSVLGGLVLYQEGKFCTSEDMWLMALGISFIIFGCCLVGRRKSLMSRRYMPGHVVQHRCLPPLRRSMAHVVARMEQAPIPRPSIPGKGRAAVRSIASTHLCEQPPEQGRKAQLREHRKAAYERGDGIAVGQADANSSDVHIDLSACKESTAESGREYVTAVQTA